MLAAEATHRDHAIVEQVIAELVMGGDSLPERDSTSSRWSPSVPSTAATRATIPRNAASPTCAL
jgi:hypothetical protein